MSLPPSRVMCLSQLHVWLGRSGGATAAPAVARVIITPRADDYERLAATSFQSALQ